MEKFEIIKEFKYTIGDHFLRGRILKNIISGIANNYPYSWEVSHYCAIAGDYEAYKPGNQLGQSENETVLALEAYLERFKNSIKVEPNLYY